MLTIFDKSYKIILYYLYEGRFDLTRDDFLVLMNKVLYHCNLMLKAEPGLSIEAGPATGANERSITFDRKSCHLSVNPADSNILLNRLADVIVERISQISENLSRQDGAFLLGNWPIPNDVEHIAQDFCSDMRNRIVNDFRLTYGLDFTLIDALSAHPYEGGSCKGGMLFVTDPNIELGKQLTIEVEAQNKIYLTDKNLRQIRKLMAGTGGRGAKVKDDNILVFQRSKDESKYEVKGYCKNSGSSLNGWYINIENVMDWQVGYNKTALFKFVRNVPQVIRDPVEDAFCELEEEFPHLKGNAYVRSQIEAASNQHHGTSLIYIDFDNVAAREWIENLFKYERALSIKMGDNRDLEKISAMDGAIIIDVHRDAPKGAAVVYAAAIMDGRAVNSGLLDRGARHNSIHTFVSNLAKITSAASGVVCALVFSEDGGITVFRGSRYKKALCGIH